MIDRFTDAELNVGKILVLNYQHGYSTAQIKKLTNAKKVSKISPNKSALDGFIITIAERALKAVGINHWRGYDFYRVDGVNAFSSALIISAVGFCTSLEMDAKNMKTLHDACLTKNLIERSKQNINDALHVHKKLTDSLAAQKIKSSIGKKSKKLEQIALGYADSELDAVMMRINAAMDRKW